MTEVPTEFSDELDIKCERNRGTKSGPKDFFPEQLKDALDINWAEEDTGRAGLEEKVKTLILEVLNMKYLLNQVEKADIYINDNYIWQVGF